MGVSCVKSAASAMNEKELMWQHEENVNYDNICRFF